MILDEMTVKLNVMADGVKQGVAEAKGALREYASELEKLKGEIKLKYENSGVNALNRELEELKTRKQELQSIIRFPVETDSIKSLKQELREIEEEKKLVEQSLTMGLDIKDYMSAQNDLERLKNEKAELEGKISVEVTANTEQAKAELNAVVEREREANREVSVKMETSGINQANAEFDRLNANMDAARQKADEAAKAYPKIAMAASAAFAAIALSVRGAVAAYNEIAEAQTKLYNIMQLTMGASGEQVKEIIALTEAYEKQGVISAGAQQAGAQELATYMRKTESLKLLLPVLNDIVAQQYGYSASGESMRSVATMLGKVFAGEVGSLKRFGYTFSEAQEQILKFGTEAEKTAALIEVVGQTVGGTNEALAKTDSGAMKQLANETERAAAAFGSAYAPAIAAAAKLFGGLVSAVADFAEKHKGLAAGLTAGAAAVTLTTVALAVYNIAAGAAAVSTGALGRAVIGLKAAFDILAANPIILVFAAAAAAIVGITVAMENNRKAQEALNKQREEYNELITAGANEENIEQFKTETEKIRELLKTYDEAAARKKEIEAMFDKNQEAWNNYDTDALDPEKLQREYNELVEVMRTANDELKPYGKTLDEVRQNAENAAGAIDKYNAALAQQAEYEGRLTANEAGRERLKNLAELTAAQEKFAGGTRAASEEVFKLAEQYPKIAEYIARTNDLTLDGGRIIKEIADAEAAGIQAGIAEAEAATRTKIELLNAELEAAESTYAAIKEAREAAYTHMSAAGAGAAGYNELAANEAEAEAAVAGVNAELTRNNELLTALGVTAAAAADGYASAAGNIAALADSVKTLEAASDKLKKGQELSREELINLVSLYPELSELIADNADWQGRLGDTIDGLTSRYRTEAAAVLDAEIANTKATIENTERRINAHLAEIAAITGIADVWGALNDGELKGLKQTLAGLEAQRALLDYSAAGGASGAAKAETSEYEKQIALLEREKKLREVSAQEELAWLERIKAAYGLLPGEADDVNAKLRQARLAADNDWYQSEMTAIDRLTKARSDKIDYSAVRDKLAETLERARELYAAYPSRLAEIEKSIGEMLEGNETTIQNNLLRIVSQGVDDRIAALQREMDVAQRMAGLPGQAETFGAADKIPYYEAMLAAADDYIAELKSRESELTEAELSELSKRTADRVKYAQTLQDLAIDARKEELADIKKTAEELEKADEDRLKAIEKIQARILSIEKDNTQKRVEAIKNAYADEIKAAEDAADAEIKIYSDQIAAIDALLKADERGDMDEDYADRLNRLQKQLEYETDEANKYELTKEITNLTADYEKRKRREGLEDEKAALQDRENAARDSLAERKAALEALRDAEIEAANAGYETYVKRLEDELLALQGKHADTLSELRAELAAEIAEYQSFAAEKNKILEGRGKSANAAAIAGEKDKAEKTGEAEKGVTDASARELDARAGDISEFLQKTYSNVVAAVNDVQRYVEAGVSGIIDALWLRLGEFAAVGREAGRAYGQGFIDEAARLISSGGAGGLTPSELSDIREGQLEDYANYV